MIWNVYIFKSEITGRFYIGCTSHLEKRLEEHNTGYNLSTRKGKPWNIVYTEIFSSQEQVFLREKQIKSYKGGNAFKKLLE